MGPGFCMLAVLGVKDECDAKSLLGLGLTLAFLIYIFNQHLGGLGFRRFRV